MTRIHIDFETRATVDIWKTGAWVYSVHPATRVLCIATAVEDSSTIGLIDQKDLNNSLNRATSLETWAKDPDCIFVAHNAFFERSIWKNIMEKRFNMPPIPLTRWRCTQSKACSYGLPKSLEKAAMAMDVIHQKDKQGKSIMKRMSRPLKWKNNRPIYDNDPEHFEQLYEYCKQDVRTERALDNALPDLSDKEQELWFYDQLINTRGVQIDIDTVRFLVKISRQKVKDLNAELKRITNGRVTKGTQVQGMLAYLNDTGAGLPNLQKATVHRAIKEGALNKTQMRVLRLRQETGKSSVAKYEKLLSATDKDGILRDSYVFAGASATGRWSGQLVQLQNLPRGGNYDVDTAIENITRMGYPACDMMYPGKVMDVLSECIRGVIVPREGHELYVADYASIEARVLMVLAGEKMGLEEFKAADRGEDEDIYVKMARRIYGNQSLTKKANPKKRTLGKQAILGCGYGCGAKKFAGMCKGYGITISEQEAQRIVDLYRNTYFRIKNFWWDVDRAAKAAVKNPNRVVTIRDIKWIFRTDRDALFCRLPSGRCLTYHKPKIGSGKYGPEIKYMTEIQHTWVRTGTYGGHLVENVTQATARDIMAYSMPLLEGAGYKIVMHTHDEIVAEKPSSQGKISEMCEIMCDMPKWASGYPIEAEGFVCQRYKKG